MNLRRTRSGIWVVLVLSCILLGCGDPFYPQVQGQVPAGGSGSSSSGGSTSSTGSTSGPVAASLRIVLTTVNSRARFPGEVVIFQADLLDPTTFQPLAPGVRTDRSTTQDAQELLFNPAPTGTFLLQVVGRDASGGLLSHVARTIELTAQENVITLASNEFVAGPPPSFVATASLVPNIAPQDPNDPGVTRLDPDPNDPLSFSALLASPTDLGPPPAPPDPNDPIPYTFFGFRGGNPVNLTTNPASLFDSSDPRALAVSNQPPRFQALSTGTVELVATYLDPIYLLSTTARAVTAVARSGVPGTPPTRLFTMSFGTNTLETFSLDPNTGAINPGGGPVPAGLQPFDGDVHRLGKFLAVTNFGSNTVDVFDISGVPARVPGSPFPAGAGPVAVDLVPILQPLDPNDPIPPEYKDLAVVINTLGNNVSAYDMNPTSGALVPLSGSPFGVGAQPQGVAATRSGFIYVSNQLDNTISGFSFGNGTLTALTGSPFATGTAPVGLAVDPLNDFLITVNNQGNSLSVFRIDPGNGGLSQVAGSPFATGGTGPELAMVDPFGRFVYTGNLASGTVSGFALDRTSGALSALPGSPFTAVTGCRKLTMDPTGRFLYATSFNTSQTFGFSVNRVSGVLTSLGPPTNTGANPFGGATTP